MAVTDDPNAFESAVSRLPYPVFVVDDDTLLRPLNEHARTLFTQENLHEHLVRRSPSHALSRTIETIRSGKDGDETIVVQLPSGSRFEVIHSVRSPKGADRWLMLVLRPFSLFIVVDPAALRAKWALTAREAEIAAACIRGQSTAEVCSSLSISRETFKTHMNRILSKSGCASRSELMTAYLFEGDDEL